jgi:hypothetical protein
MGWSDYAVFALLGVGLLGFVSMTIAFMLLARQGSWKGLQPGEPGARWPLSRRLMFTGAMLGTLFGVGVVVLSIIPGGLPWTK